jgi:hypothetical protein
MPKETPMHYKTMVLALLQERTELHERLRSERMLLTALETYARGLKASHEAQKELLALAKPESDPCQIASEALEIALRELEDSLPNASHLDANEPLSLDAAMAYLRSHTSPA